MHGAHTFGGQRPQRSSAVVLQTLPKSMKRIVKGIVFDMDGAELISLQTWALIGTAACHDRQAGLMFFRLYARTLCTVANPRSRRLT